MGFADFLGNERIVGALRGALRAERVPGALLFTGASGVGKYTLARMFAQAATCERLKDDFCGECETCKRVALLADPATLVEQGLTERGESADAATVERMPLILQTHPDVWALMPDPVRLKTPVVRPMLRVGQIRAVQRAAYFQPMGRRRIFILDGADTMRWDVANVFLKILEEPPASATLILIAPSPYSLLPTIVSRCMQFHFAPLPQADVERILKEKTERKGAEITLAAQLAEGSPGLAMEMDVESTDAAPQGRAADTYARCAGAGFRSTVYGHCGAGQGPRNFLRTPARGFLRAANGCVRADRQGEKPNAAEQAAGQRTANIEQSGGCRMGDESCGGI